VLANAEMQVTAEMIVRLEIAGVTESHAGFG
jgi:hypothetical protein